MTKTKVVFSLPELGEKQHTVYVNPYTGAVQGTLTWFGSSPAATWLDVRHRLGAPHVRHPARPVPSH